jgi:hypothetical protein
MPTAGCLFDPLASYKKQTCRFANDHGLDIPLRRVSRATIAAVESQQNGTNRFTGETMGKEMS